MSLGGAIKVFLPSEAHHPSANSAAKGAGRGESLLLPSSPDKGVHMQGGQGDGCVGFFLFCGEKACILSVLLRIKARTSAARRAVAFVTVIVAYA